MGCRIPVHWQVARYTHVLVGIQVRSAWWTLTSLLAINFQNQHSSSITFLADPQLGVENRVVGAAQTDILVADWGTFGALFADSFRAVEIFPIWQALEAGLCLLGVLLVIGATLARCPIEVGFWLPALALFVDGVVEFVGLADLACSSLIVVVFVEGAGLAAGACREGSPLRASLAFGSAGIEEHSGLRTL